MKKCLIIVPVYNESISLPRLIDQMNSIKNNITDIILEFLFIDDGSVDNSKDIIENSGLNYITLSNNLGIGGAMQCGFKFAARNGFDYTIQLDGDGQHPPEELRKLLLSADQYEEDLIIGSRFIGDIVYKPSIARRIGMIYSSWLLKFITGKKIYDTTSGYRLIKYKLIHFFSNEYPQHESGLISLLMAAKAGFRFREIPIQMNQRQAGKSSISMKRVLFYPFKTIINSIATMLKE
jgi:glycosyltransferase involved in cell wall biosynthesis